MLGQRADREVLDDPRRPLIDHVDGVRLGVGDVHARRVAADPRGERPAGPRRRRRGDEQRRDAAPRREARRAGRGTARRGASVVVCGESPPPPQPCHRAAGGEASRSVPARRAADRGTARAARGARRGARRHEQPPPPATARSESATGSRPAGRTAPLTGSIAQMAAALGVARVAAAADDVEPPPSAAPAACASGAGSCAITRTRWRAGSTLRSRGGRRPVGPAGDEEAPADRRGGRVAERMRERRDVAHGLPGGRRGPIAAAPSRRVARRSRRPCRPRPPPWHRTSPPEGARRGGRRSPRRRCRVRRPGRAPAPEGVGGAADRRGPDARGRAPGARRSAAARRGHPDDVGHRPVRRVESAGRDHRAAEAGHPGQRHRRGQRPHADDAEAYHARGRRPAGRGRPRPRARMVPVRPRARSAPRHDPRGERRDEQAACGPAAHARARRR